MGSFESLANFSKLASASYFDLNGAGTVATRVAVSVI
jgi:hypothetical protein